MWRKRIYRFRHLLKYCVRTGTLHKVQHSRTSCASELITHWQSGVGSCWCRWRLRRVALRNTWGPGPVKAAVFKLKLKMTRCCTFYNIARPGWLIRCYLTSHPQVQSWGVTDNVGASPQEGMSSGDRQTYWHVLSYEFHHLRSCHLSLVSSDAKNIQHKIQST